MEISELWRYPVKSMLGERRERAHVAATGVVGDRAYAVIDRSDGKVASAKNPRKWRALLSCHAEFIDEPDPGEPPGPVRITLPDGVVVTSDDPKVHEMLSTFLGREVTLADAAPPGSTFEETWPDIDGMAPAEFIDSTRVRSDEGEAVSDLALGLAAPPGTFFDLAPIHLVTTSSLDALSGLQPGSRFSSPRFRPNVVIDGPPGGFVENDWVGATVRLGEDASLSVMMPTMRCVMTTLAQGDLPDDRAILRAATEHNRVEISGLGSWACVGAYASVVTPGRICIGDAIDV
ncbi:MAG: uncharacterized protein QOI95_389 [Acidimicrobiaceae bacterium]|jgi:uncharacterized protein YcbX